MIFQDRTRAGIVLAEKIKQYADENAVILAVPRGGVPVACAIAGELTLPLQLLYVKKIGHPQNREYAIGAVGLEDSYVIPNAGIGEKYIEVETARIRKRLQTMRDKFDLDSLPLKGKTLILVDDGIATGTTLTCAVRMLKKKGPGAIVVATPVASRHAARTLGNDADAFVAVQILENFGGVGEYYDDFHQLDDEEVLAELQQLRAASPSAPR